MIIPTAETNIKGIENRKISLLNEVLNIFLILIFENLLAKKNIAIIEIKEEIIVGKIIAARGLEIKKIRIVNINKVKGANNWLTKILYLRD